MSRLRAMAHDLGRAVSDGVFDQPTGRRRLALLLYATLGPVGLLASIVTVGTGSPPLAIKAGLLVAAFVWLWLRRRPSVVEWIVLLALVPAASSSYSAWLAGARADGVFLVAIVIVAAFVALAADAPIVMSSVVAETTGFLIVELHLQTTDRAVASTVVMAMFTGVVAAVVFVTARQIRRARDRMQETLDHAHTVEAERAALIEQMPAVTLRNDCNGDLQYVSSQIEDVLGYDRDQFIAMVNADDWTKVIHPDDRGRAVESIRALRKGERSTEEIELRFRNRSGGYRHLLLRRARVDTADGGWYLHSVAMDITDLREAERRSREATAALIHAAESERARIATELHDDTIQVLAAAALTIDRIPALLTRGATTAAREAAVSARHVLALAVERTRTLTFELRPQLLEASGVGPAVSELVATLARDGNLESTVDTSLGRFPPEVEALVYRTVREALTNVRKHAQATSVTVDVCERGGRIEGMVRDDGRGFDPALLGRRARLHFGIEMMRERLSLAGGDLRVVGVPGEGTTVTFEVPTQALGDATDPGAGRTRIARRSGSDRELAGLRLSLAVTTAIADRAAPERQSIVRVACEALAELVECDAISGYVALLDAGEQVCVFDNDTLEENLEGRRRPLDRGTAAIVFTTRRPLLHSTLADGSSVKPFGAGQESWLYQSVCSVPVALPGHDPDAAIGVYALEVNQFDRGTVGILSIAAGQVAGAIARAGARL